jgi:dimethyl sulfoxide reductase iron-sulfur subunit
MARYGIVVDLNRCVGCMTCVINCKEENLTRPGVWWNQILQVENEPAQRITYLRYACMHCDDPPCAAACPNQAIHKRADGIVLVDKEKCAGAGECMKACPYDVIIMTPDKDYSAGEKAPYETAVAAHRIHTPGKASMCTLCYHRIDQGRQPACVAGCPSKAMIFGDLDDPDALIQLKRGRSQPMQAEAGSRPKVTYVFPEGLKDFIEKRVKENPHQPG